MIEDFPVQGFLGPIRIFSAVESRQLKRQLAKSPVPDSWPKGCAATSSDWFEIATTPKILDRVASILGTDVMLCGANLVEREPGQIHAWHSDVHLLSPVGRSVTVWLGLENTSAESSLHIMPGSHRYGFDLQERAHQLGIAADNISAENALDIGRQSDPNAQILQLAMGDGDALFVDGRIWHGSANSGKHRRAALLLHYATPDKPVRIHAPATHWPFTFVTDPLPPCQMVRGTDRFQVNRMVPAPSQFKRPLSKVYDLRSPIREAFDKDWIVDALYLGSTRCLSFFRLKTYVVHKDVPQHEFHSHAEEQITIPLAGELTLLVGESSCPIKVDLRPGTFSYIPPGTLHTYQNKFDDPVSLLSISWKGTSGQKPIPLGLATYPFGELTTDPDLLVSTLRSATTCVEGATATLDKLKVIVVDFLPRFAGEMHVDAYDVVMLVHTGKIETLNQTVEAGNAVFYAAGEPHAINNSGSEPARCVVFELHSSYTGQPYRSARRWVQTRLPRPLRKLLRSAKASIRRLVTRQAASS